MPVQSREVSIPGVVGAFKSVTTNDYIQGVKERGWPAFTQQIWKRNYYEHIIRDSTDLTRIQKYILNNPANWPEDTENPDKQKVAPRP